MPRHYVEGTVAGVPFSRSVGFRDGGAFLVLSAEFRRAASIDVGQTVEVVIKLAGPGRGEE